MVYNKVEICGINTSKLKVLKEKEKIDYIKKMKAGDKSARDKLVNGNLKLVLSVIQKFAHRGENMDDLFQIGCVGLIKAIDAFDENRGVRFSTYAVPMIVGELRRYLRDYNSIRVSRSLKDTAYKAMHFKEELTKKLDREPTIEEIAAQMGIEKCDVVMALESITDPISLHEPLYSDGGDTIYVIDQIGDKTDDKEWLGEILFKQALSKLNDREKNILTLRFFSGKTQVEVAKEIGISQAQVSRIEKCVLDRIRGEI